MSKVQPSTTGVQAGYANQVAADLETNLKEQERISSEIAALQEQLHALESDHQVLVKVQQALGSPDAPARDAKKAPTRKKQVPAPRAGTRKSGTAQAKDKAPKKAAAKKPAQPAAGPTLVELIRDHLRTQSEPRSASEITNALTQAHPDRTIKPGVVRTTVENLVAKGQVERAKQGFSVFYTTAAVAEPAGEQQSEAPAT
ncbi:hypothetical protein [Streptomyces sp. 135]|uniref:hypothetical protein n=1 Tax=Streptomyces sp. 135 TaxID=2838850 RepID=UPI001CBFA91F|nr:hypothetical protein [Streptomyces sp. 135]